jgi:hypothetical protein
MYEGLLFAYKQNDCVCVMLHFVLIIGVFPHCDGISSAGEDGLWWDQRSTPE